MSSGHDDPRWGDPRTVALLPGRPGAEAEETTAAATEAVVREPRPVWHRPAALLAAGVVLGAVLQAPVHDLFSSSKPAADAASSPAAASPGTTAPTPGPTPSSGGTAPSTQTPPAASGALDSAAIAAAVDPGVVDIDIRTDDGSGSGTGILLTSSGRVLTVNHVIDGATRITVTITATGKQFPATVVGTDRTDDVAVIQLVGARGLTPAPLGTSAGVAVGDPVAAIGNAGGRGGTPVLTTGTVTALDRTITATDASTGRSNRLSGLIETDAALEPGDSGGPLVSAAAKVIGLDTAASVSRQLDTAASSDGYAIPIDKALTIARQMVAAQGSNTIHIGLPGRLGVLLGGATGGGVSVASVTGGSPAEGAGIRAGDVITAVGGTAVTGPEQLVAVMAGHRAGQTVSVQWRSADGTRHTATVHLTAGPAD